MLNNLLANITSLPEKDLDRLRVRVKYLIFDLEATKRERDDYCRIFKEEAEDRDSPGLSDFM